MKRYVQRWQTLIYETLKGMMSQADEHQHGIMPEFIIAETPPRPELGDIAFPMFLFAKTFRQSPHQIAEKVASILKDTPDGTAASQGPYVNVRLNRPAVINTIISEVNSKSSVYGNTRELEGQKIVVEFSCPNTNKPLHLGHLRNDALGESVSSILRANGADIRKVILINDRGIHICKSMLAYKKFGDNHTPEDEGLKSDHFVGKYYVTYANWEKTDKNAEVEARAMLKAWEDGDPEVRQLWEKMNRWAIDGIKETYEKNGRDI